MNTEISNNFYEILLSYEIPYNILDGQDQNILGSREELLGKLKNLIPEDKYDIFSVRLTLNQFKDTLNYLVTFRAYFRSTEGLPMEEYVEARKLKDIAASELENFFNSVDCDYKKLNIKTFV